MALNTRRNWIQIAGLVILALVAGTGALQADASRGYRLAQVVVSLLAIGLLVKALGTTTSGPGASDGTG